MMNKKFLYGKNAAQARFFNKASLIKQNAPQKIFGLNLSRDTVTGGHRLPL